MMSIRPVKRLLRAKPTLEGAGVHLRRVFGFGDTADFDPFLLLDDFRNDEPEDYLSGFPWHPHRGIETITYVLAGTVEHGDSIGNRGVIAAGDIQWMTAGSGIIHQEMPTGDSQGRMYGFQLWANLPASLKMTDPRYQGVTAAEVPVVTDDDGAQIRVVCGRYRNTTGPVNGVAADPMYLDVSIPAGKTKSFPVDAGRNAFAYVFEGNGKFSGSTEAENRCLVLFDNGDEISVIAGNKGIRFLLVSGKPLREPVAWHGPIVMNTQSELQQAFKELEDGTFLKRL
jgi:redox-sensitive bicupin YhaK (pirin superfamily)